MFKKKGGKIAIVDMIPNEERTGNKFAVDFSSIMLSGTENGDTYTLTQVKSMLKNTGFNEKVESYVVSFGIENDLIIAYKN